MKHVNIGGKKLKLAIWDTGNNPCVCNLFGKELLNFVFILCSGLLVDWFVKIGIITVILPNAF